MKKFKTILLTISMLFVFLMLGNLPVFAQDSDTGPPEGYPPTQLYFNKESVKDGDQVTATLELDNQTNADLMNVTLETTLPEGLYSENTTRTYDKIATGQKILHSFTIQVGEKSSVIPVSLSSVPSNPVTGTPSKIGIGIGIVLAALLIVFCIWLCKRKKGQKLLSIALCLLLTTQLLLTAFPNPVYAEEESDADASLSDEIEGATYSVNNDLNVNEIVKTLATKVSIGSAKLVDLPETEFEALQTNSSVAAGAAFFDIVISSQEDSFSDAVKAEDIVLKNAFENTKIDTITLLDDHTLTLSLTGPLDKEDKSNGMLELNKDCFKQDGEKEGHLMVDISSPLPYFAEGTDNVHLNEGDTAVLQFSIDTAQFSQTADASSFTFDDPAIQPVNLTIPSTLSSRDGLLEVRVNGAESKTDMMNALRGVTMTIDSAALNCDSLTLPLTLEEERINTDLILANAVRSSEKETQATAEFTGRVSSLNGSVDLTQGTIALADEPQPGVSVSPLKISGDSNNRFSFTVTIDDPVLPNWAEEDEGLETFFAYWAYSQKLYLDTNCVIDAYGVPVQASEYAMVVYESDVSDDELLASNASGQDIVAKSFIYTSKILSIANYFAKEAPWGIGAGILGLGGDALSSSGMGEIKENLIALNAEVAEISRKTDAISQELKDLINHIKDTEMRDKVSAFGKEADSLAWTVNKVNSPENDVLAKLMEVTDTESTEYHTYVNEINNTVAYSAGGGDTFAKDTLAFGKSILGDDFMESDSTLDVYVNLYNSRCNWASQTINPKSNFLAYANSLYLKAYMMSMCYMKSSNTNHQYDHAIEEMKTQFQAFLKKSDVYNEAMVLPEGKDINLIDGKEYSYNGLYSYNLQNHFERSFPGRMFSTSYISSKPMYMKSFTELVRNTFDARNKSFNTINKNPDMETLIAMKSRLNSSGKTSILEELTDLGFNTKGGKVLYIGNSSLIDEDLTPSISIGYEYGAKAVYRFYGDVFNLKTGTAQVNEHLFDVNVSAFAYKKWDAKISLNLLPEKIISFIR